MLCTLPPCSGLGGGAARAGGAPAAAGEVPAGEGEAPAGPGDDVPLQRQEERADASAVATAGWMSLLMLLAAAWALPPAALTEACADAAALANACSTALELVWAVLPQDLATASL